MERIASGDSGSRRELFTETANQMGVGARIVEKDFWVCWALKQLFSLPSHADHFIFKGGTTLSKIFNVITRFSEDVDVAVNWVPLGFTGDRDPATPMSKSRRSRLQGEMLDTCRRFIAGELQDRLQSRFTDVLKNDWGLEVDPDKPDALNFYYPKSLSMERSYLKEPVVLELGTHAELTPNGDYDVVPYAAEKFPDVFQQASVHVRAIQAERTFWEKATILHAEHHRPAGKPTPIRHSRHYYDTVMLARSEYGARAVEDTDLLKRVVEHKQCFYPSAWSRYDLAVPGSLKLVPAEQRIDALRADYAKMEIMFFGPRPGFQTLLDELAALEAAINAQ